VRAARQLSPWTISDEFCICDQGQFERTPVYEFIAPDQFSSTGISFLETKIPRVIKKSCGLK